MSKIKKKNVGKIGYCDNSKLPGLQNIPGGHYVYIQNVQNNKCEVNVVTSLEDKNGVNLKRINQVRNGNVYPIPLRDSTFIRWSGIGHNSIKNVDLSDIKNIGNKKIKTRHKFFIGKFMK